MPAPWDLSETATLMPIGTQPNGVTAKRVALVDVSTGTTPAATPFDLGQDLMANSLPVAIASNQTPLPVSGRVLRPSANPTLTVHASYVSGDYVGPSNAMWIFLNAFRNGGPQTGVLNSVVLIDKAAQSVAGELWLFSQNVTVPADSAAWDVSDADAQNLLGVIPFTTYYASASNSVCPVSGIGLPVWNNAAGDTALYGAFVTRGSPTYASGDLTVVLGILGD